MSSIAMVVETIASPQMREGRGAMTAPFQLLYI